MTNPSTAFPGRVQAWWMVAVFCIAGFVSYVDRMILSVLVEPVQRDLGIGDAQTSLLQGAAFAVVYVFAGLPLGILADRKTRRNLIILGSVIWTSGTLLCGLAPTFWMLFAARILVGVEALDQMRGPPARADYGPLCAVRLTYTDNFDTLWARAQVGHVHLDVFAPARCKALHHRVREVFWVTHLSYTAVHCRTGDLALSWQRAGMAAIGAHLDPLASWARQVCAKSWKAEGQKSWQSHSHCQTNNPHREHLGQSE